MDACLWAVGAFLALRGETRLWRYLHGEIDFHAALKQTAKTNLLLAGLSTGRYVLCFDNFHVAGQIPELTEFFRSILKRAPGLPAALRTGAGFNANHTWSQTDRSGGDPGRDRPRYEPLPQCWAPGILGWPLPEQ